MFGHVTPLAISSQSSACRADLLNERPRGKLASERACTAAALEWRGRVKGKLQRRPRSAVTPFVASLGRDVSAHCLSGPSFRCWRSRVSLFLLIILGGTNRRSCVVLIVILKWPGTRGRLCYYEGSGWKQTEIVAGVAQTSSPSRGPPPPPLFLLCEFSLKRVSRQRNLQPPASPARVSRLPAGEQPIVSSSPCSLEISASRLRRTRPANCAGAGKTSIVLVPPRCAFLCARLGAFPPPGFLASFGAVSPCAHRLPSPSRSPRFHSCCCPRGGSRTIHGTVVHSARLWAPLILSPVVLRAASRAVLALVRSDSCLRRACS